GPTCTCRRVPRRERAVRLRHPGAVRLPRPQGSSPHPAAVDPVRSRDRRDAGRRAVAVRQQRPAGSQQVGRLPAGRLPRLPRHGPAGTLQVTAIAAVVAFPFGLLLALGRLSRLRPLSWISTVWIEFFRGIPMLLVVYGFLLALPAYGITFPRFWMLVFPMFLVDSATT